MSAGGVVVEGDRTRTIVLVPTRRAADGSKTLSLPKGNIDPGESALQAARREVREEAGVEVELLRELGEVKYWYVRGGRRIAKRVVFFLFTYVSGSLADHDHEIEEARWMDLEDAARLLTYDGEREMVRRAIAALTDCRSAGDGPAEGANAPEDR